ncbi:MAG: hypothetical protein SVV03_02345 [Candidatus Nanohaloarchaea archaeon]|nr:hypothetical protein [Candidatus Nanohaloarchaea archaeon]
MSQSRYEMKVSIAAKLWRNKFFGKSYTTIENALSKIPKHDRGKGKKAIDEMYKEGFLEYHKNREMPECVSTNLNSIERVKKLLKGSLPDFLLDSW